MSVGPFERRRYACETLEVDVGPVAAAVAATAALSCRSYDIAVSAGIAGGFPGRSDIGDVVIGSASVLADLSVEGPSGVDRGALHGWADQFACASVSAQTAERIGARLGEIVTGSRQTSVLASVRALADRYPLALADERSATSSVSRIVDSGTRSAPSMHWLPPSSPQ